MGSAEAEPNYEHIIQKSPEDVDFSRSLMYNIESFYDCGGMNGYQKEEKEQEMDEIST